MLFNHQNDTYRLHDKGSAISVDVLEGCAWLEVMYECIPAHQGEKLFVVSTRDLVLITSTRLTISLMIQPKVCIAELKEIMKPLEACDLVDVTGINQYLVFLFKGSHNELQLVQAAYRLVDTCDVAMQLLDVCSMQELVSGPNKQQCSSFMKLQSLPQPSSTLSNNRSPPPPPPPKRCPGRLNHATTIHKTDATQPLRSNKCDVLMTVYLIVDHPACDDSSAPAFQVSLHRINLSSAGMTLSFQSVHSHSLPICNSVAITDNSIVLIAQSANENRNSKYLHYSLQHDTLMEHPAPFFDAYDLQAPLLFLSGAFLLCPRSGVGTTIVIDFAEALLGLQIRDPTIKSIYPKDDTQRRTILALQSKDQRQKENASNISDDICSTQPPDKRGDGNIADLLLSPYYSPTNDAKEASLRPYLLSTYSANSIPLSLPLEHSLTHPISRPIEIEEENSLLQVPLEHLLRQLVKKYIPDSRGHDCDPLDMDTDCGEVRLEEVQLEVLSLSKHTKEVIVRNQTRIQSLQTGVDNPYIALHDLMLSLSNDTYVWMQKQMLYFLLHLLPTALFPERDIVIHSYSKHRQLEDNKDSDELARLSMQLGSYFILSRWSKDVQRALVHLASAIASSKIKELEKHDPNFLSSIHFILAMLSNFTSSADCHGRTKLTAPLECNEDLPSTSPLTDDSVDNNSRIGPFRFPSDASYMHLFVYITLLSALFRKTVVAEGRCYSVQGDQIRTASQLDQGVTYNLVFPAYASADDNKLFTEAVWIPFVTRTEFSLPSLR